MNDAIAKLILIIEDDEATSENLLEFLVLEGFRALIVGDGESAYHSAKIFKPSLVSCDFQLPGMSGIEIYLRFRSDEKLKEIPFLIVTACADKRTIDTIKLYNLPCLTKPFSLADFTKEVKRLIS